MLALALKFILAHFVGDFLFQPSKWVADKREKKIKSKFLYFHVLIHFFLLLVLTAFQKQYLVGVVFITVTHYVLDVLKSYLENTKYEKTNFFVDQFLHLTVLAVVLYYYHPFSLSLDWLYETNTLALLAFLTFTTYVTSVLLKILLSKWSPHIDKNAETNNAGKYIGILERLFIFFFVVMNFWEGIGFLLAAKSIFRFGDLKDKQDIRLTEYILIGTLLSFGIGIMSALFFQSLLV